MIDWIRTAQEVAAIVAAIFATFAMAGAEEQEGGEPPPLAGAGSVVCLMG